MFEYKNANSLFIYTTGTQKHYGLCVTKIHLHYVSNLKFFHENMRAVLNIFRVHFGLCAAIYVDKRLVADNHYILSLGKKINSPKIRSKLHLNEIDIDALYSEAVLL
ncbi:MAG: hypothetical protein ACD_29C00067G0002 [uncultured bacterium]|nr:MAG: hypothetical protein ACD_29C00067G0002 [uncultured bacterium]